MAWVNLSLLLGGGLFMAAPIVLHLVMREQPKQLMFPALRFVRQRKESNTRKFRLRHWLLLALRCLAILLVGAALARPSVSSTQFGNWLLVAGLGLITLVAVVLAVAAYVQHRGRVLLTSLGAVAGVLLALFFALLTTVWAGGTGPSLGDRTAPVAAVLIVDTAPHMQYRYENKTRLAAAQELASGVLKQLPEDSDIAVLDTRAGLASFAVDRAAAAQALQRLQITGAPLALPTVIKEALELIKSSDKRRQDLYIFTDLSTAAWDDAAARGLSELLQKAANIGVYVVDVGVDAPQDYALGELRLSAEQLPQSSQLEIQTEVRRLGPAGERVVEVLVDEPDSTRPVIVNGQIQLPDVKVRHRRTLHLDADSAQALTLQIGKLPLGVHQGQVRIVGEDALAENDVRYFTVSVQPAWKVLVASPRNVSTTAWTEAISPYEFRETGQARYECVEIPQADLANQRLSDYAAVVLLDPGPLAPAQWEQLKNFVEQGGGLGVFLGHAAEASAFNTEAALAVMPGQLNLEMRVPEGTWLDPRRLEHPILAPFRTIGTQVPWRQFPVFRYWSLKDLAAGVSTLIPFADGRPALLERALGRGHVLVMTTPISDPLSPQGRKAWNELPTGENAWPYFILANEMAGYLVASAETRLNYLAGQTARLTNEGGLDPDRYQLFSPTDDPYEVTARDGEVTVKFTDIPGAYRLKGQLERPIVRGFSVNLAPSATELTRITAASLDEQLGQSRYRLVKSQEEITVEGEERVGREFFSYLALALALVLAWEHVLSNRFYKQPAETATA
jgi:hypothetical protein